MYCFEFRLSRNKVKMTRKIKFGKYQIKMRTWVVWARDHLVLIRNEIQKGWSKMIGRMIQEILLKLVDKREYLTLIKKIIFNNNDREIDKEIFTASLKKNGDVIKKRIKSTKDLFDEMIIYEMHRESECSKNKDIQTLIITSPINRFNIIEEESDTNFYFRV